MNSHDPDRSRSETVARPERRWALGVAVVFGAIAVMVALLWGLWSWIASGEPRGIDIDPLSELAAGTRLVRPPAEKCPNGSPPAEPCSADALVTAGGSLERTVSEVADNAQRSGFSPVRATLRDEAFRARREDLCVSVYNGPDPFDLEPGIGRPAGTALLYLSYC